MKKHGSADIVGCVIQCIPHYLEKTAIDNTKDLPGCDVPYAEIPVLTDARRAFTVRKEGDRVPDFSQTCSFMQSGTQVSRIN